MIALMTIFCLFSLRTDKKLQGCFWTEKLVYPHDQAFHGGKHNSVRQNTKIINFNVKLSKYSDNFQAKNL